MTVSHVLPAAGGVFHGHLATALLPALEPKSVPSRSGFTLTVAAALLRQAGSGPVYPLVLHKRF